MTTAAWLCIAVAGALALADWIAVSPSVGSKRAEYVLKPATMIPLIAAAAILDPERDAQRALFVAALVLSLAGDVFLMLPRDLFVAGLGSFLLGHIAYIGGFLLEPRTGGPTLIAGAVVVMAAATLGRRIITAARASDAPAIAAPVAVYMMVISIMVVLAAGTAEAFAIVGAAIFFASDAMIAWDRFVRPFKWARPLIMASYHVAQAALVISLTR
ncbi:MAG: lysoplasmalogenase [Actinomycetota bacterium]